MVFPTVHSVPLWMSNLYVWLKNAGNLKGGTVWISPPKFSPLIQKRDDPSSRILCKRFTLKIWHFSCGWPQKQSIYARLPMLLVGRNSGIMPLIMVKRVSPLFGIWYVSSAIRNMRSPHVHYVKQQNLTYHYRPIL